VNLTVQNAEADLTNYVTNGEWDLVELSTERHVVYYSCCEAPYPDITYMLVLRRRPLFYGKWIVIFCSQKKRRSAIYFNKKGAIIS